MRVFKDYKKTKEIIDQVIRLYPESVRRYKKLLSDESKSQGGAIMSSSQKHPLLSSGYLIFGAVNFGKHGTIHVHCSTCKGLKGHLRQFNYYKPSSRNVTHKIFPCTECLNERLFDFGQTHGKRWYFPIFKYLLKNYLNKRIEAKQSNA